jgi:hypothetical protein
MALRIRFQGPTASTYGFSIERLVDGLLYDFSTSVFSSNPTTFALSLPENTPIFPGQYKVTLSPTLAAQFTDGDYAVTILDQVANVVVAQFAVVMHAGDDATQIPGGPVVSVTAPVTIGTNNDKFGYSLTQAFPANFATNNIFATGGIMVASYAPGQDPASLILASPANKLATDGSGRVTSGTVTDKSGYGLAASGLDSIAVEQGINARQALAPILAASAGMVTGAGTGTILIRGANVTTTRITATTDNAGNRSSVTLSLPT